jgi:hypothetical protein
MVEVLKENDVKIAPDLLKEIAEQIHEQGQVVLHFLYQPDANMEYSLIRIWPTTYLYDRHSLHRSQLVHTELISLAPEWTPVGGGKKHYFTLIFSGLPQTCKLFDFIEECNSDGPPFELRGIERNNSDVYFCIIS